MSQSAYSPKQAAAEVGLHPTAIYNAIDHLDLPAVRHGGNDEGKGGRLLILHDDLMAWIKHLPPARTP